MEECIKLLNKNKDEYLLWINNSKRLKSIKESLELIDNEIIQETNKINSLLEGLSEDEINIINSRIKGILMISKMNKSAIKNGLDRLIKIDEISIDIEGLEEKEIYDVILKVEEEKKKITSSYFNCIETYLLPIVDGIVSGIAYAKSNKSEFIKENILKIYEKILSKYDKILNEIFIKRLDIKIKDNVDFNIMDVIDIEEIEKKELDETVESVIRNPFEYKEDLYNQGYNYIVRKGQVIAFKCNE